MKVQRAWERDFPGELMLVNADHPISGEGRPDLVAVDERHPEILMERRAAGLLSACIRAVGGWGEILPVSGWRSRQEQQAIWDETMEKEGPVFTQQYVARPGCSEHETGLAIDLGLAAPHMDLIRPNFPDRGVCAAFRRRAAEYGFVLRYPQGKEPITGIAHEPWHFRYVGVPHGAAMTALGLTLEEYLAFLTQYPVGGKPFVFEGEGRSFQLSYCAGPASALPPPEEGEHRLVSADNRGGRILTRWWEGGRTA